jgi:hypothetical protein
MKKLLIVVAAATWFTSCLESRSGTKEQLTKEQKIEHGKYLVTISGCHDCHTPKIFGPKGPALDTNRLLSGYRADMPLPSYDTSVLRSGWALFAMDGTAAVTPVGVAFAANITSDETGIGNWSYEQFRKCIKEGKFKGLDNSRPLMPPMPWENFVHMSDTDLESIYLYLKSTRPVKNVVPASIIGG